MRLLLIKKGKEEKSKEEIGGKLRSRKYTSAIGHINKVYSTYFSSQCEDLSESILLVMSSLTYDSLVTSTIGTHHPLFQPMRESRWICHTGHYSSPTCYPLTGSRTREFLYTLLVYSLQDDGSVAPIVEQIITALGKYKISGSLHPWQKWFECQHSFSAPTASARLPRQEAAYCILWLGEESLNLEQNLTEIQPSAQY